jgi:ATP-dependent protease Clp ATPase subunit
MADLRDPECSVCGKPTSQAKKLVRDAHTGVGICNECVGFCLQIIGTEDRALFDQIVSEAKPSN